MTREHRQRPRLPFPWIAQFLLLAVVWGSSFLLIKVSLRGLTPGQVVWGRLVLGALTLGLVAVARRQRSRVKVQLRGHLFLALLLCVVPFLLYAQAERRVPSSLASVINATTPLFAALLVLLLGRRTEHAGRGARSVGLLVGFTGVVLVVLPWRVAGRFHDLAASGLCLAAAFCYAAGFVYLHEKVTPRGMSPHDIAFSQVLAGAVVMLALTPWVAAPAPRLDLVVVSAMATLGCAGTGLAYIWNCNLVAAWGPVRGALVTYAMPVVGVLLGALLLGEPVTWNQLLGTGLVITGWLVTMDRLGPCRVSS